MNSFSIKTIIMAGIVMILAGHAFAYGPANGYGDISSQCLTTGAVDTANDPDNTVCVQFAGASAPKAMGAEFALHFLTVNGTNGTIYHYANAAGSITINGMTYGLGAGDLNVWTGVGNTASGVSGSPLVLSFASLHSMDGYGRLTCQQYPASPSAGIKVYGAQTYYTETTAGLGCNPAINPSPIAVGSVIPMASLDTQEPQIDFHGLAGGDCASSVATTYNLTGGGSLTVQEVKGCSLTKIRALATTVGASDVRNTTYKNIGPINAITNPLSNGGLTVNPSFFIPFQFAVSSSLVYTNPKTGVQEQPRLTREVIQSLFNNPGNIPTWSKIPGFEGNSQAIFLCMRLSGSGTKASVNSTVLRPISEYPGSGATPNALTGTNYSFNFTGGDLKNCLSGKATDGVTPLYNTANFAAIGYINADSLPTYPSSLGTAGSLNGVFLEGELPYNDPNHIDAKATIKNMTYPYFTQEQLMVRSGTDPDINTARTNFIAAFLSMATDPNVLIPPVSGGIFNAGKYWVAPSDMCSTRANTDLSPHKSPYTTAGNVIGNPTCPIK